MSAVKASPAAVQSRVPSVVSASPEDSVRVLQHALYRAAKADPGRRFHALRDKVYRRDVLWRAWTDVRRNDGAAGIDRIALAMVEEYGVTRVLDEVAHDLREGTYRPFPTGQGWLRPVVHSKSASVGREPGVHHHEFVFDRGARRWSYEQPRTSLGGPDLEEVVHLRAEA